ncbi:HEAT repeat domain-containing protein [Myxococcus stipitatus]|uniref:HEAT repeat domain-containing protein n=1 Tax=Myxococcus stipitatus TaxID=83455 RepID=UPI0030D5197C
MAASKILGQAKKLLEDGEAWKARDLLLKEAYGPELAPTLQDSFEALFPVQGILKKQLEGPLKQLKAKDAATRRKAASLIDKAALDEVSTELDAWLKDPRTTHELTAALADEDPKVVEKALEALGAISERYFVDFRAFPAVVRHLGSAKKEIRLHAVITAWALGGPAAVEPVVPLFQDKAEPVRAAAVLGPSSFVRERKLTAPTKKLLLDALTLALKDTSATVREQASSSLRELGDAAAIPHLRKAVAAEKNEDALDVMKLNLEYLQKGGS